jgi:hypothetical protein
MKMSTVLSELTWREIDRMSREELLEAYHAFSEVCRYSTAPDDLEEISDSELRDLVYQARRQYQARGY